jgi:hypothetical protein
MRLRGQPQVAVKPGAAKMVTVSAANNLMISWTYVISGAQGGRKTRGFDRASRRRWGFYEKGGPHIELMVKLLVWLFLIKLIILYIQIVVLSAALGRLKARK